MASEWKTMKLADFASHQKGFAFKSKDYIEDGIAVVRVSNLTSDSIDILDLKYVSDEVASNKSNFKLFYNDVVIATVGSWPKNPASVVGKVIKVPKKCDNFLLNQNSVRFRVKSNNSNDQLFLYYLLKSKVFSDYIISTAQGSANQASITLKDIYAFEFNCPSSFERKQIAQILSLLDGKSEVNQQTNQTLEQMAQALFKSWFVDFDPVFDNALAAGTAIDDFPAALQSKAAQRALLQQNKPRPKALPQENRKLFPSEFEQSNHPSIGIFGWIPKGWQVTSFESIIKLIGGGTPKTTKEEYWNGDIPWFSVVDSPVDSNVFVINTEKHVTQLGVDKSSTKILRIGTTIISARGTVGKCALVADIMAMNQSCYGINGIEGISDEFIYFMTRYQVSDLQKRGHGSIFNTITRETFKSIFLPFSGGAVTQKFSEVVTSFLNKILSNNKQSAELAKTRDVLLPKLISGELSFSPKKT